MGDDLIEYVLMKELNLGTDIYKLPKKKVLTLWNIHLELEAEKQRKEKAAQMKTKSQIKRGRR